MINKFPKITIVTVVLNGVAGIENTILSVINQDYPNKEYIIIDGGSVDGTLEIIKIYQTQIDIFISEKDKGIYHAMNKGICLATGEWINFMNSGDNFVNNSLLASVFFLNNFSTEIVLYGSNTYVKKDKIIIRKPKSLSTFKFGMPICHQSIFIKLEVLKINLFDVSYIYASDYDQLYKIYKLYDNSFCNLNKIISNITANGFSENNSVKTYIEYKNISYKYDKELYMKFHYMLVITERFFIQKLKNLFNYI